MTVGELMDKMTHEEVIYWTAFYILDKEDADQKAATADIKSKLKRS